MDRRIFIVVGAAAGLAACASVPRSNPLGAEAARDLRFSSIEVTTAGTGYLSGRARGYASQLGPDLDAALRRTFADRIGPDGTARMVVEASSLNVAGGGSTATGRDQSRLTGNVRILNATGALLASYTIDVFAGEAAETRTGVLIGLAINRADRFYRQLVGSFAEETRARIEA